MYCSPEVIDYGMIPFGSDLKIVETADNCIAFILVDDGDENEYYVCSNDGKIVEFNWLELKGL